MLAGETFRIGLANDSALEEPVDFPIGDDVVLLLQAVHRDGHGEPDGIEHDKRCRTREIPLAHAREEKVWEYAVDAGFTPLEDRCIIVKGAAGDLSEKIVRFFETCDVAVLQMCENELILLPFSPLWATLERDVTLVVPYEDIESVKLVDDLLNVIIDIETRGGAVRLTTQQKELSDIRLSGIYATQYAGGFKNWHAENVNLTLQALSELGHKTSCE